MAFNKLRAPRVFAPLLTAGALFVTPAVVQAQSTSTPTSAVGFTSISNGSHVTGDIATTGLAQSALANSGMGTNITVNTVDAKTSLTATFSATQPYSAIGATSISGSATDGRISTTGGLNVYSSNSFIGDTGVIENVRASDAATVTFVQPIAANVGTAQIASSTGQGSIVTTGSVGTALGDAGIGYNPTITNVDGTTGAPITFYTRAQSMLVGYTALNNSSAKSVISTGTLAASVASSSVGNYGVSQSVRPTVNFTITFDPPPAP